MKHTETDPKIASLIDRLNKKTDTYPRKTPQNYRERRAVLASIVVFTVAILLLAAAIWLSANGHPSLLIDFDF